MKLPAYVARHRRAARAVLLCGVALALLAGGYIVYAHQRRAELPAPTGPYQVGRMRYDWSDPARVDPLADAPGVPRALAIWVWYPATVAPTSRPAPYLPANWRRAAARSRGLLDRAANAVLDTLAVAGPPRAHAYANAPPAAAPGTFPVVIMQPGMGLAIPDYTAFAEDLASHGYVVVGVNETDSSTFVAFADGQAAPATAAGKIADDADAAKVARQEQLIEPVWGADAVFVMNTLQRVNADATSPFYRRLDVTRFGLFGHSFGGATALDVCLRDARCAAGADLDGTPTADTRGQPVPVPFLFLTEDYPRGCAADANCAAIQQAYQLAHGPAALVSVAGAAHSNFSDIPARFTALARLALRRLGVIGAIDPRRGLSIISAYLVAFFDRYLKDAAAPQAGWPPAFPETRVTSKP